MNENRTDELRLILAVIGAIAIGLGIWKFSRPLTIWFELFVVSLILCFLSDLAPIFKLTVIFCLIPVALLVQQSLPPMQTSETEIESVEKPKALVTLGRKDGRIADLVPPQGASSAGMIIYFHNSGRVAARRFSVGFLLLKSSHFVHMTRTKNIKNSSIGGGGGQEATIAPDSDFQVSVELPADQAKRMMAGSNYALDRVFPMGIFEYCARSDDYQCQTFTLFFQGPPFNRFDVTTPNLVQQSHVANFSSPCMPNYYSIPTPSPDEPDLAYRPHARALMNNRGDMTKEDEEFRARAG